MSFKQKIKNLWKNHKEEIIAGGVILGCVGVAVVCDLKRHEEKVEEAEEVVEETALPSPSDPEELESKDECIARAVKTFVKDMDLQPGESYVIALDEEYDDEYSTLLVRHGTNYMGFNDYRKSLETSKDVKCIGEWKDDDMTDEELHNHIADYLTKTGYDVIQF